MSNNQNSVNTSDLLYIARFGAPRRVVNFILSQKDSNEFADAAWDQLTDCSDVLYIAKTNCSSEDSQLYTILRNNVNVIEKEFSNGIYVPVVVDGFECSSISNTKTREVAVIRKLEVNDYSHVTAPIDLDFFDRNAIRSFVYALRTAIRISIKKIPHWEPKDIKFINPFSDENSYRDIKGASAGLGVALQALGVGKTDVVVATGSVNRKGLLEPVGGMEEKIEAVLSELPNYKYFFSSYPKKKIWKLLDDKYNKEETKIIFVETLSQVYSVYSTSIIPPAIYPKFLMTRRFWYHFKWYLLSLATIFILGIVTAYYYRTQSLERERQYLFEQANLLNQKASIALENDNYQTAALYFLKSLETIDTPSARLGISQATQPGFFIPNVLSLETGKIIHSLKTSPDGRRILSISGDKHQTNCIFWSVDSSTPLWETGIDLIYKEDIRVEYSPNNQYIVIYNNAQIVIFDIDNGTIISEYKLQQYRPIRYEWNRLGYAKKGKYTKGIIDIQFLTKSKILYTVVDENILEKWLIDTESSLQTLESRDPIEIDKDSALISTYLIDIPKDIFAVNILDTPQKKENALNTGRAQYLGTEKNKSWLRNRIQSLRKKDATIRYTISENGEILIYSVFGEKTMVYSLELEKKIATIEELDAGYQLGVLSNNGKMLVTSRNNDNINIWSAEKGNKVAAIIKGEREEITAIDISPKNDFLISGNNKGIIRVWKIENNNYINVGESSMEDIYWPLFGYGKYICTVSYLCGTTLFKVYEHTSDNELRTIFELEYRPIRNNYSIKMSENGKYFLLYDRKKGEIRIWNTFEQREIMKLSDSYNKIVAYALSPSGKRIITKQSDNYLKVWNIENKNMVTKRKIKSYASAKMIIAKNDKYFCIRKNNNEVQIRAVKTLKYIKSLKWNKDELIHKMIFSKDSRILFVIFNKNTIIPWRWAVSDRKYNVFAIGEGNRNKIETFDVSASDNILISRENQGVELWDLTGKKIATIKNSIGSAFFDITGEKIVSIKNENEIGIDETNRGTDLSAVIKKYKEKIEQGVPYYIDERGIIRTKKNFSRETQTSQK